MGIDGRPGGRQAALAAVLLGVAGLAASISVGSDTASMPEFTQTARAAWLNSVPLTVAGLRGRPVLVEFWTFGCSNCRNTLPWLKHVNDRFGPAGLVIVGVHTPEFPNERDPVAVQRAVERLAIRYPVMLDNDAGYWRSLGNRYWPAFYLFDANGRLAGNRIGELHQGRSQADTFERQIAEVVASAAGP